MSSRIDSTNQVEIRPLGDRVEYDLAERLQAEVWGPADVVPAHHLIATAHNGGLVLGAFAPDQAGPPTVLVGLSYAFPGHAKGAVLPPRVEGRFAADAAESAGAAGIACGPVQWYLYSHMLAVKRSHQALGLGFRLKQAQREWAIANGFTLITWTFDPLETANARLNIGKLGGVVRRYVPDYYGELRDGLNAGLPTDRFILEWWLDRAANHAPDSTPADGPGDGSVATASWPAATAVEVEIPADFQTLKRCDPEQAVSERLRTRAEFVQHFAAGLIVTRFAVHGDKGVYRLEKTLE